MLGILRKKLTIWLSALVIAQTTATLASDAAQRIVVSLPASDSAGNASYDGRLFVFLSSRGTGEPRRGPNWFSPDPFFGLEVRAFRPGESRAIDDSADGFPAVLSQLPPGKYRVQAVLDHALDYHNPGTAPGNLYSSISQVEHREQAPIVWELALTEVVEATPFPTTDWQHEIQLQSQLLSAFHGRDVVERAAIVLPASYYESSERRYPVVFHIPGFGGSYRAGLSPNEQGRRALRGDAEFIHVYLSADCRWGHHVFANSATNGPRGDAFIQEMIPHIDASYRTIAAPTARFVTGHSSGGWASLWLQVTYPEHLGGCWSTAPDPVDFRDFQRINLYADPPPSIFIDERGERRPIARLGERPVLYFDRFSHMDDVLRRGGQLRSFEAVFSPRGPDGEPARLWNRVTGRVNPHIVAAWRDYDIRYKLERDWQRIGPLLAGKLHIWMGELDTFYLEGAVKLLRESLQRLGSDAQVVIVPGRDHANLTADLRSTIARQMSETARRHHPQEVQLVE